VLASAGTFLKTCQDIALGNALSNNTQKTNQVFANMYFVQLQEV
jgi:hypothetical protein